VGKFLAEVKNTELNKRLNRINEIAEQLGKADGEDFRAALADPTIRPTQILKALQARGITMSGSIITRYRQTNNVTR
jgi:hypothetical protein